MLGLALKRLLTAVTGVAVAFAVLHFSCIRYGRVAAENVQNRLIKNSVYLLVDIRLLFYSLISLGGIKIVSCD